MAGRSDRETGGISWKDLENDLVMDSGDAALFQSFGNYMRGVNDLEEVRNDPELENVRSEVGTIISDFADKKFKRTYDRDFIKASLGDDDSLKKAAEEIKEIKFEIHRSNVNDLTAEWVKEWHENRKKSITDPRSKERRDFILSSLESETVVAETNEPETDQVQKSSKGIKRSQLIRYISLAAAAVLVLFVVVRALIPSYDPEKLYNSYFAPFDMVSPMTRVAGTNSEDKFSQAVEKYRTGDYLSAKASFTELLSGDSASLASRFLLGLSCLAMDEYDNAVFQLENVTKQSSTYRKEATWYLGLAYLKKGEKERAAGCFGSLAQSPGYYNERAREILRRLK